MKNLVFLFFIFHNIQFVSSQETFFSFIEGWTNYKITEKNNNYISIGTSMSSAGYNRMQFVGLSSLGDSVDNFFFEKDTAQTLGVIYVNGIISKSNTNYLCGFYNDTNNITRGLFLKINSFNTETIVLKEYILTNEGTSIRIASLKNDTSLLLGAYNKNSGNLYSTLLETDTSGNIRWQKDFICNGNCLFKPFHILPTADNGMIFTCFEDHRGSHNNNEFLKTAVIKTDSLGNTQWRHTWGGDSTKNEGSWVVPLDDGNFLFAWTDNQFNGEQGDYNNSSTIHFFKFDINGNEIWQKSMINNLPITGDETTATRGYNYSISQMELMPDGNIIVAGCNQHDGLLLKIDQEANYIWHRELMPPGLDFEDNTADTQYMKIKGVTFTSDNGFILAGEYLCTPGGNLIPDGLQSAFAYKLDEYGCYDENCHIGVEETKEEEKPQITIYPNPSNGMLNINHGGFENLRGFVSKQDITLKIFNVFGQLTCSEKINTNKKQHQINLSYLPKGIYFVDIGGLVKKKIILE